MMKPISYILILASALLAMAAPAEKHSGLKPVGGKVNTLPPHDINATVEYFGTLNQRD
jgi:hypothetical protein